MCVRRLRPGAEPECRTVAGRLWNSKVSDMSSEDKSNNNASPDGTNKWFQADAFMGIVNAIVTVLLSGICCLITSLPLVLVMLVVNDVSYWPLYFAAAVLSSPSVAALYAIFRDHPALLSQDSRVRMKRMLDAASASAEGDGDGRPAFPPDWLAAPYVRQDASVAMFRPYFAAYAKLWTRSFAQGLTFGLIAFALLYNSLLVSQFSWGIYVVIPFAVCGVFLLAASSIAMVLVVEYPKAKYLSVLKNSVLLSVRRVYILLIALVALVAYGYGLFRWTMLMGVLGTGVLWYLIWGASRWQAQVLFSRMAAESGDDRIVEMYQAVPVSRGFGFLSGITDYKQ